ncbi:cobyrinate a,c-diamide synthase [Dactylosporangium sp. NBC_01737]|uniref:cobyrinate a,c-diamide synthase n=1 Tax=Dactylosporangium sp. NBC_01737 TaxID=2975959 RepID=UPI002E161B0B
MSTIPRLVISAPSSGHGKTAVSVGLLSALSARGYRAAGFKIGPDHVDAAYLGLAAGRPGRNLDPRMIGAKRMGPLFAHGAASLDIAVVEGTMGLFDGLAGRTDSESTAQISGLLRAPVVLVVDVGAMGQSVAALVHGFRAYDELLWLGGVILNRVASSRHEQLLREALDDIGVPVLGALRRHALTDIGDAGAPLPSRHHGVAPVVHHNLDAIRAVRRLGEVIAGAVDIDRVMALARSAPRLTSDPWSAAEEVAAARVAEPAVARIGRRPIIGVAFSYPETAELLAAAGAEVVPFDPLRDEFLPDGVDGLVVGGALPESYAEELGFNTRLRTAVAAHAAAGKPIAAEGTGLVWLCRDFNGRPMCGVVDASARETDLVVLGYREATARSSSVLLPVGAQVVGHKMHRTTISPRAGLQAAWTWAGGPAEGFVHRGVHASYLGLHWAGTPSIASRFVAAAGATATPVQGQWTTPSTHPYNRPSVVPASQAPSGSGTTLQFPATAGAPANLAKTAGATRPAAAPPVGPAVPGPSPVSAPAAFASPPGTAPAASPVSVPGPVSAPGGYAASPPATYSPPASVVGPGAVSPVSAPSTYAPPSSMPSAPVSTPSGPRPPVGPPHAGGRPAAPTRPLSGTGAPDGVTVPAWLASAEEAPTETIQTAGAAPASPAVQTSGGPADAGDAGDDGALDEIASSPFGPTSRAGVALASASHAAVAGSQAAEPGSQAAEPGNRTAGFTSQAPEDGREAEDGSQAEDDGQTERAGTAVTPGAGPSTASAGASVGVPSTPNAPAEAAGLPSSGVVSTTLSAPPPSVQSPTSPAAPPAAAARSEAGASGPVSGAGAAGSQPVAGAGVQPVSTPPLSGQSGHQWSDAPATSSAVPVSSAPMPSVAAPVSAAPAGMTVIAAAGSDLVASDEAPTAYLQLPAQGGDPLGAGDHSPVSAPPAPAPPPQRRPPGPTRHGRASARRVSGRRVSGRRVRTDHRRRARPPAGRRRPPSVDLVGGVAPLPVAVGPDAQVVGAAAVRRRRQAGR